MIQFRDLQVAASLKLRPVRAGIRELCQFRDLQVAASLKRRGRPGSPRTMLQFRDLQVAASLKRGKNKAVDDAEYNSATSKSRPH